MLIGLAVTFCLVGDRLLAGVAVLALTSPDCPCGVGGASFAITAMRPTSTRDRYVHQFLSLADGLALRFQRRYPNLLDLGDAQGVARLELVQACSRVNDPVTAAAYLKRCIHGALQHHLRDRALLVRLPASARGEIPWQHQSLDQALPGGNGSWLDVLPAPDQHSKLEAEANDPGLELLIDQLPAAQAAALRLTVLEGLSLRQAAQRLGLGTMTVQRAQKKALAALRDQVSA